MARRIRRKHGHDHENGELWAHPDALVRVRRQLQEAELSSRRRHGDGSGGDGGLRSNALPSSDCSLWEWGNVRQLENRNLHVLLTVSFGPLARGGFYHGSSARLEETVQVTPESRCLLRDAVHSLDLSTSQSLRWAVAERGSRKQHTPTWSPWRLRAHSVVGWPSESGFW